MKRRELKKSINNLCGELFAECIALNRYENVDKDRVANVMESILMMVAAEEGISILPSYITNKLTDADNLTFVPLIGEGEYEQIISVWKKDNQRCNFLLFRC